MFNVRYLLAALAMAVALSQTAHAAASKVFTVTNTGNGPLTVSGAAISGNTAEYAISSNNCGTVAMGGNCTMTVTFSPAATGARPAAALTFNTNGTNGAQSISLSGTGAPSQITYTLSANASDVNMAALFGNPTAAGTYVLTINSGVYVTATSTANAALTTGTFPAGSTVKIVNNGYVLGKGGEGGVGGSCNGWNSSVGGPGQAGGPALALNFPVSLDNAGYLFGGGGGGGGGLALCGFNTYSSAGGGGGAGNAGGAGGVGVQLNWGAPRTGQGGSSTGGQGGARYYGNSTCYSGAGGNGGEYGSPGAPGGLAQNMYCTGEYGTPAAGGAGGYSVVTNGNTLTWINGNTLAQVKGAVQ